MADMDGTETPPVRPTPAKRPRTAAQIRAAQAKALAAKARPDTAAEPVEPDGIVAKPPAKRPAKKTVAEAKPVAAPEPDVLEPAAEKPIVAAVPERSWSTPAPAEYLPEPQPGVPISKTQVAAAAGLLGLLVVRRRRRKRR